MADGFDPKVMLKNLTKSITDYGKIMGERSKISTELITNQMKLSQNWLWKLKEQQAKPEYQYQQTLKQMFEQQQERPGVGRAGAMVFPGREDLISRFGRAGQLDIEGAPGGVETAPPVSTRTDIAPFEETIQPQIRRGTKGYEMYYPSQKQFIYSRIKAKRRRNIPLTEKEKKFEESYLGIEERPLTYQELEARRGLEMVYKDQIRERAKQILEESEEGYDSSDESIDTFLSDPENRSLILDEIIGR